MVHCTFIIKLIYRTLSSREKSSGIGESSHDTIGIFAFPSSDNALSIDSCHRISEYFVLREQLGSAFSTSLKRRVLLGEERILTGVISGSKIIVSVSSLFTGLRACMIASEIEQKNFYLFSNLFS